MPVNMWAKFSEYGLVGIIIGVLFLILWKILIWVMGFIKDITSQQNAERQIWLATLNKHADTLTKIADSIDIHDKRAEERGRFVRDEHTKMIEALGRINGYKS